MNATNTVTTTTTSVSVAQPLLFGILVVTDSIEIHASLLQLGRSVPVSSIQLATRNKILFNIYIIYYLEENV